MKVWIVTTATPEEAATPCFLMPFATQAEAEAHADKCMREEWLHYGPEDEETGDRLPYPGNWREAQQTILTEIRDGSWGEWQITDHHITLPEDDRDARIARLEAEKAAMLAALERVTVVCEDAVCDAQQAGEKDNEAGAQEAWDAVKAAIAAAKGGPLPADPVKARLLAALNEVRTYDKALNDAERAPDGDDYNELFGIIIKELEG